VHLTFYLVTGKAEAANPIWAEALSSGHELGNRTQSNSSTGTAADVDAASAFIQQTYGVRPWTMAAPGGDASYVPLALPRFLVNRGSGTAMILPNDSTNPFDLPSYAPAAGTTSASLNAQIDLAQAAGAWRIVTLDGFTGVEDGALRPIDIAEFVANVNHAKGLGNVWIDSVVNVAAYWRAKKILSLATPTVAGMSQTYSWTLPPNYPPGKCLRVKVAGGTLTQAGNPLVWDSHGYYEIALDAGSLTISP